MKQVKNPHDFYRMANAMFGETRDVSRLGWAEIEAISVTNDVRVPGWVRASATGKGKNKVYSTVPPKATSDVNTLNGAVPANKPKVQYYVKVSPRNLETNKFMSVKDDPIAQAMTADLESALNASASPVAIDAATVDPEKLFSDMADLVSLVVDNVAKALLIYGGGGTGKSFGVYEALRQAGYVRDEDFFVYKGKVTPASLYQIMFIHRDDNKLLVFDDADSAWESEDSAMILKGALDTTDMENREISWSTNRTVNVDKWDSEKRAKYAAEMDELLEKQGDDEEEDAKPESVTPEQAALEPEKYFKDGRPKMKAFQKKEKVFRMPAKFVFHGRVIFISNKPRSDFDKDVLTRCYKIDMSLTPEQMFMRMEKLLPYMVPEVPEATMDLKHRVLVTLKALYKSGNLENPSLRTFDAAIRIAARGKPNWADLLRYT
jgi:hypothetical protein